MADTYYEKFLALTQKAGNTGKKGGQLGNQNAAGPRSAPPMDSPQDMSVGTDDRYGGEEKVPADHFKAGEEVTFSEPAGDAEWMRFDPGQKAHVSHVVTSGRSNDPTSHVVEVHLKEDPNYPYKPRNFYRTRPRTFVQQSMVFKGGVGSGNRTNHPKRGGKSEDYEVNDIVEHPKYGMGVVTHMEPDAVSVAFENPVQAILGPAPLKRDAVKKVPLLDKDPGINLIVGGFHASTPDSEIVAEFNKRAGKLTPAKRQLLINSALAVHHENQKLYHGVMTGNL